MFIDVNECINWINNQKQIERRTNLSRMEVALKKLKNIENNFAKIHVAGTNGKGSTVAFLKNILIEAGYKVGSFISPYVVKFNERICYNDEYISDADLIKHTNMVLSIYEELQNENESLSFFEILTLIAFCYFNERKVDYAIIEVGMGGTLDATNAINYELSIITNIGLDHMNYLGNTIEEIALSKLGIVKEGNHLITTVDESLQPLFLDYCQTKKAKVTFLSKKDIYIYPCEMCSFEYENKVYDLNMLGFHQAMNAYLAISAVNYLLPKVKKKWIKLGLEGTTWPGRLERVNINPRVVLDGAHNILGIRALVDTLKEVYKNRHIKVVFAALKDKETAKMLEILSELTDDITLTQFDYYRNKKAEELALEFPGRIIIDPYQAVKDTIISANDTDAVIITGSLYFISLIRPMFKK